MPASSWASRSALSPASWVASSFDLNAPLVGAGDGVGDWADVNVPVARSTPIIKAAADTPIINQLCSFVIPNLLSITCCGPGGRTHSMNSHSRSHLLLHPISTLGP